jgi:phosphate transport system substrate-binding protein
LNTSVNAIDFEIREGEKKELKGILKKATFLLVASMMVVGVSAGCSSGKTTITAPASTIVTTAPATTVVTTAPATTVVKTTTTPPTTIVTTTTAPPTTLAVSLNGAGATFPNPLYSQWFSEYYTLTGTKVNYQSVGSGAGITAITNGTVNFGASDGILTQAQLDTAQAAYGTLVTIPMTAGAEAVIYNLAGIPTGQLKLTGDVLANIYLGVITKWNDPAITTLNPTLTLPNAAIATIHRSDSSGTTNIFTNYLDKISPAWHAGPGTANSVSWPTDAKGSGIGGSGNAGVAGSVQQIPNSIGYVELAYAIQNTLPYAQMKNAAGSYITPSVASATAAANGVTLPDDMRIMITNSSDAAAYPIVGFTWILVYTNQTDKTTGTALVNMLWWAIHDGQKDCAGLYYAQLSSAAVTKAETLVKSIKYQGTSLYTG